MAFGNGWNRVQGLRSTTVLWGHGFATEATRLMVGYLYGETDIEIIMASAQGRLVRLILFG